MQEKIKDDTISRQAAIDANGLDEEIRCEMCKNPIKTDRGCDGQCKYDEILYEKIIQILNKRIAPLPSAQPELCEDAVSRRRLLSDLKELTAAWGKYSVMAEQIKGVETAIGYVETIPSVTPERKKGKWIVVNDAYNRISGKCSVCGWEAHMYEDDVVGMDYCPNCGADMRGEQDDR